MLQDLGYRVLAAPGAAAVLTITGSGFAIDRLSTDVVMPGSLADSEVQTGSNIQAISVLMVEDEPLIRMATVDMLMDLWGASGS